MNITSYLLAKYLMESTCNYLNKAKTFKTNTHTYTCIYVSYICIYMYVIYETCSLMLFEFSEQHERSNISKIPLLTLLNSL